MSGVSKDIYCYSREFFFPIELKLFSARFGPLGLRNGNKNFVSLSAVCLSVRLSNVRMQNLSPA